MAIGAVLTVGVLDPARSAIDAFDIINGMLFGQSVAGRGVQATMDAAAFGAGSDDPSASSLALALPTNTQP